VTPPLVFEAMGTVVSLHAGAPLPTGAANAVRAAFATLEERFSLWIPGSEGARFARQELRLTDASPAFRAVHDEAIVWRARTEGAFTPYRPDGVADLSGIVKALAIADAGAALRARGVRDWCLNAGGDVLTDGVRADRTPWVVGIVDPGDRTALLSRFDAHEPFPAVATSGVAERGDHVWRLGADDTFTQVSVCAADIVTADVLATAILAGGPAMLRRAHDLARVEVLACAADGRVWASRAFRTPASSAVP